MRQQMLRVVVLGAAGLLLVGCAATYYKVTDPTTGKVYYTEKVSERGSAGAVEFKDARTGNSVTLQNSEVDEVNEDQFASGRAKSGERPTP